MDSLPRPPTVVSLEWDYCYDSVLIDRSPGVIGVAEWMPADLGLSPELTRLLDAWLHDQEVASGRWVRDDPETEESLREEARLRQELLDLAYTVQHELGPDVEVLIWGEPLSAYRLPR